MPLVYDTEAGAFVEAETPRINMGGVFCDSIGRIYQDGAWRDVWPTKLWLYREGDECSTVTGGWGAVRIAYETMGVFGAVSKLENCIRVTGTSIDATTGVCTNQKVPISRYNTLYARVKKAQKGVPHGSDMYNSAILFRCCDSSAAGDYRIQYGSFPTNEIGDTAYTTETGIETTLCVDISKINIDTYILITSYGTKEYYIYEVWME